MSVDGETLTLSETYADTYVVMFGAKLTLRCNHEQEDDVLWYINSEAVEKEVQSNSELRLVFTEPGVYQCKVSANETIQTATICGVGKYTL